MSKTIIIAWKFSNPEKKSIEEKPYGDHKVIKFFTKNADVIDEEKFTQLKEKIQNSDCNLFAFIHYPNFNYNDWIKQLTDLNNHQKNIHIKPFSGGGRQYEYEKLIDEGTRELKELTEQSVKTIFEELEIKFGKMALLESTLELLEIFIPLGKQLAKDKDGKQSWYDLKNDIKEELDKHDEKLGENICKVDEWLNDNEAWGIFRDDITDCKKEKTLEKLEASLLKEYQK